MLLFALACADPVDSGKDSDVTVTDTTDTDTACDPIIGTMTHPDFYTSELPVGVTYAPSSLDPATDLEPEKVHVVVSPTSGIKSRLFVMLPDVGGSPVDHETLLGISVLGGQRSIGLAWPSALDPEATCGPDLDCWQTFGSEVIHGTDDNPAIAVDASDSIEYRLLALLRALDAADPMAGWSDFYSGDTLTVASITMAGFGYGANLAQAMGRDVQLAGSVFFAGGCDTVVAEDGTVTLSATCDTARATDSGRMYGMVHTEDEYEARSLAFPAMGMDTYGDFTNADVTEPRYCTSTHMLTTSFRDEQLGEDWHKAVAHDDYISVDDRGMPLDVVDYWYMLTLADR